MPKSSRHKSHRRRRDSEEYSTDSDNEGSAGYGHGKSGKSKGGNEVEKKNRRSVSVSDERWEGGGGGGDDALSMLAYLERDSRADSDSSCREDNQKSRRHKSKQAGVSNGVAEIRVSGSRRKDKETLEAKKEEGDFRESKSRVKSEADGGRKEAVDSAKKESISLNVVSAVSYHHHHQQYSKGSEGKEASSAAAVASSQAVNVKEDASEKKGLKNTEWKLQDELRNPELEKELENRIQRRREESGDRDRWRDGDRDREGKSYSSRDSHHRDERYKTGKHKDDRSRGDRYKDERQADDKSRSKRYKEEWHKDDAHRTDKYKDDNQRDEKPREDRHKDERQKDDRHREAEHKDDKYKDDKSKTDKNKEDKLEDKYKEDKYREDKYKDEKHRGDTFRDDKNKDEKYKDKLCRERTADICDSKHYKDESKQGGRFKESNYYDSDQEHSSYYDDRGADRKNLHDKSRLSQKPDISSLRRSNEFKDSPSEDECRETSRVCQGEVLVQERLTAGIGGFNAVDVVAINKNQKRANDIGPNISREQKRIKVMEGGSDFKDALLEERPLLGKEGQNAEKFEQQRDRNAEKLAQCRDQYTEKVEQRHDHSKGRGLHSTRVITKRYLDKQRTESPADSDSSLKSSGCRSPLPVTDPSPSSSPSPSTRDKNRHSSFVKTIKRKRPENDRAFSSERLREEMDRAGKSDRCKPHSGCEDEKRHREAGVDYKDSYGRRGRSQSIDRVNSQLDNSRNDRLCRAPSIPGGSTRGGGPKDDASVVDHHSRQPFTVSGEGLKTAHHSEEVTSNKSGWAAHIAQNSRSEGFPAQHRTPPFSIRPPGHLPPPPPFRPGIDNPSVLGRSNGSFDEGPCSRDQGRGLWNANAPFNRGDINGVARSWNPQAQGSGSGNYFIPFQHQAGGPPPGAFHNMGQQPGGPPMFRGLRPAIDMNPGGTPYHMWDNGDRNLAHNGAFGWQRQMEDVCGPPGQGSFNGWDGYTEESVMYGRRDWYPFGQGVGNRSWDRATGITKEHKNDTVTDFPHNESDIHGRYVAEDAWGGTQNVQDRHKKLRKERSPESIQIKRSDEVSPKVVSEKQPCLASEVKKTNNYISKVTKYYLSKLDVSIDLAGPDLYNQAMNILGGGQSDDSCKADLNRESYNEDHQLEDHADAEALISSFDLRQAFFPTLSVNIMQRAMELYKEASKQIKNASTSDIFMNVQTADQIDELFSAGIGSKEQSCMADNEKPLAFMACDPESKYSLHCKSLISEDKITCFLDDVSQNDMNTRQEVSETALKGLDSSEHIKSDNDMDVGEAFERQQNTPIFVEKMKSSKACSDEDMKAVVLTGDYNSMCSHLPILDSSTPPVDGNDSGGVAWIGEGTSYSSKAQCSKTFDHVCIFCASSDYIRSNGNCIRCQGGNLLSADVCHDSSFQQGESQEHTQICHEEALKLELVDFKELVSAACIVHILREVSFHVGLPAIQLPRLVEVAICKCLQENL